MTQHVSTNDPDFPRWIRSAAIAINSLIGLVETTKVNEVRYNPAIPGLEYWDGTAWLPV